MRKSRVKTYQLPSSLVLMQNRVGVYVAPESTLGGLARHPTPIAKSGYASAAMTRHDLNLHPSPGNVVPFNNATIESCTSCIHSMVTRYGYWFVSE